MTSTTNPIFYQSQLCTYEIQIHFEQHRLVQQISPYLPKFACRMPYNWRTPHAYFLTSLFEYFNLYYANSILCSVLSFLIGSCVLLKTFIEDITADLISLKMNDKTASDENRSKIVGIFCKSIQNHADLKQLSVISFENNFLL